MFPALMIYIGGLHAGQCQTVISTFARANGGGYSQVSFWKDYYDWEEVPLQEESGLSMIQSVYVWEDQYHVACSLIPTLILLFQHKIQLRFIFYFLFFFIAI